MRTARTVLLATVLALALPGLAHAGGRLIETGHDADWGCAVGGTTECHFIKVAVNYVRNGAPDPTKKLLVLDKAGFQMRDAIAGQFPGVAMDVVNPLDPAWDHAVLSPSVYSAIVVASDQTCGKDGTGVFLRGNDHDPRAYCDLNRPTNGTPWPPPDPGLPADLADSNAIARRSADIKAFFDAGGGVFVGSGADDGDGHDRDTYYSFIDLTGGANGSACDPNQAICLGTGGPLALTGEGRAIGFIDSDINCGLMACASHNSFQAPRVGSALLVAETGPGAFDSTLFEDANPPNTLITSGPGTALTVAPPAPPVPVVASTSAAVGFAASEDTTTFACSLDGGAAKPCQSPATFTGLSTGVHKVTVTATDAAHNVDATPAEISWLVAFDSDHDGYLKSNPFGASDCNDTNAAIHPTAVEIRGNRVDENCDQVIAPFVRLKPGLAFHFVGARCADCVKFDRLALTAVPRAATVRLRCRGPHCPHLTRTAARAHHHKKTVNLLRLVRRLRLVPGRTLEVSVTQGGTIGAVLRLVSFRHRGATDVREVKLCRSPGARKPARHCAAIH